MNTSVYHLEGNPHECRELGIRLLCPCVEQIAGVVDMQMCCPDFPSVKGLLLQLLEVLPADDPQLSATSGMALAVESPKVTPLLG